MDFVFVHGGGQGSWTWQEVIAALDRQEPGAHRCLALDMPGCGTKRGRDTSAISHGEAIAALADEVAATGLVDPVLVGHSQAGTVLPGLVAAAPGRFARAIYVSCLAPVAGVTVRATVDQVHAAPEAPAHGIYRNPEVPPRVQWQTRFCNDMPPARAEAFLDRLGHDVWPESSQVWTDWRYDHLGGLPATYVLCLEDRALPAEAQEAFARRLGCERTVRVDCGHQIQQTRPHALAEIRRQEAMPDQ